MHRAVEFSPKFWYVCAMPKKSNKNIKVLVGMSGGVDSSVAAALLVAQGYDVTGSFMVNYDAESQDGGRCWTHDYQDALRVAAHLGIPLLRLDFTKEYKKSVLDYMYSEYRLGRTPNPDVLCNKFVKFGSWLDKARELGFDKLATGHYARIANTPLPLSRGESKIPPKKEGKGGVRLMQAKDDNKDQTYFLHQLNQEQLTRTLFPLGNYTKPQVRKLAKKFRLATAEKEESMGICFIGEVPMKEFLMKEIKTKKGDVVLSSGEKIGEHDGLSFYTIGQRSLGIKTDLNRPLYVVDKKEDTNTVIVGYEDDPLLYKKEVEVGDVNWVAEQEPAFPLVCQVRLRHRQSLQKVVVDKKDKKIMLKFTQPQRAITPGQFAVFYKKNECLGGGVVK